MKIREIIYLDFEKASSLHSQLEDGLIQSIAKTEESKNSEILDARGKIPGVLEGGGKSDVSKSTSVLQTKRMHHDILKYVEAHLDEAKLVTDIDQYDVRSMDGIEELHAQLSLAPYVRASGRAEFEDYNRMRRIAENFNDIRKVILNSSRQSLLEDEGYRELLSELENTKKEISNEPKRGLLRTKLQNRKKELEGLVAAMDATIESSIDEANVEPAIKIINIFYDGRIALRLFPDGAHKRFQVICTLNRDAFTDHDLENIMQAYGVQPTVELRVFGVVTSIPRSDEEISGDDSKEIAESKEAIDDALRGVFKGMFSLESYFRPTHYPRIMIHPVAVYREFEGG